MDTSWPEPTNDYLYRCIETITAWCQKVNEEGTRDITSFTLRCLDEDLVVEDCYKNGEMQALADRGNSVA